MMADQLPQPSDRNPATSVIVAALGAVRAAVDSVALTLQRFESRQSPGMFKIHPEPFRSSERLRTTLLVIESGATSSLTHAAGVNLVLGSKVIATLRVAINHNEYVLPATFDRGQEIQLIDVATGVSPTEILDAFLIGYTE